MNTTQRLIYVCRSRCYHQTIAPVLLWSQHQIYAMALYGRGYFFQWAEGSEHEMSMLQDQLMALPAGFEVRVLDSGRAPALLSQWRSFYELEGLQLVDLLTSQGMLADEALGFVELVNVFREQFPVLPVSWADDSSMSR